MMSLVAEIIVVMFGLFLLVGAGLVFAKPAVSERFFSLFASSPRTHYTEQAVRLLVGAALVAASPAMWQEKLFWLVGWAIVQSSVALILAPWRWHQRFGERIRPTFIRRMKLYAVGIFVFGALLLYGVLSHWAYSFYSDQRNFSAAKNKCEVGCIQDSGGIDQCRAYCASHPDHYP